MTKEAAARMRPQTHAPQNQSRRSESPHCEFAREKKTASVAQRTKTTHPVGAWGLASKERAPQARKERGSLQAEP